MTPLAAASLNAFTQDINASKFELLGEILSWSLPEGTSIKYSDLRRALQVAGLDEDEARKLLPRYAFSRALKQMQEDRVIKKIAESDKGVIAFQFTKEQLDQDHYEYHMETILFLEKETGFIYSDNPNSADLVERAKDLLAKATEDRTTADVSRVIKRLFEKQADLFPVRPAGGVYFVPQKHEAFVESIDKFVTQLNGTLTRFPVPAGTQKGNKSVKNAVKAGLQEKLAELRAVVESFGTDTRESTVNKHIAKIEQAFFKAEAYSQLLEDERKGLDEEAARLRVLAKQKLAQVLDAGNA